MDARPPLGTATTDKTACDLVRRVFSSAAQASVQAGPGLDGITMHCSGSGTATPASSVEDDASNKADSCAETAVGWCSDDELDRAYRQYGGTSHMGMLDASYGVFASRQGHGALVYKIRNRTLVVAGDPLCPAEHFQPLLEELREFRRGLGLKLAFLGVGEAFAKFSRKQGWATLHFSAS